jgi:predicted transcriptional regulator
VRRAIPLEAPAARKAAIVAKKTEGKSNRQIAAELGVDEITIRRDLAATHVAQAPLDNATNVAPQENSSKTEENSSPLEIPLEAPAPRGEEREGRRTP